MRRQSELPGKLQPQQKLSPGSPTPSVADPSTNNAAKPCADNEADNTAVVRGQRVEGTTKGGRSRVVSIDRETVSIPREHRRQAEERQAASTAWTDNDGLVFTTKWGEPLYPDTVTALMNKLITAYNKSVPPAQALPHARLHDLRHLHATPCSWLGCRSMSSPPGLATPTRRSRCASTRTYSASIPSVSGMSSPAR